MVFRGENFQNHTINKWGRKMKNTFAGKRVKGKAFRRKKMRDSR